MGIVSLLFFNIGLGYESPGRSGTAGGGRCHAATMAGFSDIIHVIRYKPCVF